MKVVLSKSELEEIVANVDNKYVPATRFNYMRAAYERGRLDEREACAERCESEIARDLL